MSGHSKWSKVKHQKGPLDVKRGLSFTKITNSIIIAVREGNGVTDPESNFRLRLAIEKAKEANMPKDNVQRAIIRGSGKADSGNLEEIVYEGFGPAGVSLMIQSATDNRQRTASAIKNILDKSGGNLAGPGAVSYNFKNRGIILTAQNNLTEEEILNKIITVGAEDYESVENGFLIYTSPEKLTMVKDKLVQAGFLVKSAEISFEPINSVTIDNPKTAERIVEVIGRLEELDDVLKVYNNFEVS